MKKFLIWTGALLIGAFLGAFNIGWLQGIFDVVAVIYTRLFQFLAVPTIALAVITTLAMLGTKKETGRIFLHTLKYTLLTSLSAAVVGLLLYLVVSPGLLPAEVISKAQGDIPAGMETQSYSDYLINVIPNNIVTPFSSGNVLSILLVAAAFGLALAFMADSENKQALVKTLTGLQEVFFTLIKALVWTLPTILLWVFLAVFSAIGNAGVPMGCFFLTLSLMSGQGAPIGIMGIILPIYTIIDMVETAENVWSDSCVCAIIDRITGVQQ